MRFLNNHWGASDMAVYFVTALFLYFGFAIANVILGGLFITRLKNGHASAWEKLGRPSSVFSARRETVEIYRFIVSSTGNTFRGDTAMFRLSKALWAVTIATHLMFLIAAATFLIG